MPSPLTPSDLGLPADTFPAFRPGQDELASSLALSPVRFPSLNAPCGTGKSLVYMTSSLLAGTPRTLVLVTQRPLQDQLMHDFSKLGLVDVRGQANYSCPNFRTCEIGAQSDCPLRRLRPSESGCCPNIQAIDRARQSNLVVTNYAFQMVQGKMMAQGGGAGDQQSSVAPGIGKFDLIVMDEAHNGPKLLSDFCTITLSSVELRELLAVDLLPASTSSLSLWSSWAKETRARIPSVAKAAQSARERFRLNALDRDLGELSSIATDTRTTWIYQRQKSTDRHIGDTASFSPVWAHAYAERYLFQGAPKVVMTSATLLPSIGDYLGIDRGEIEYIDVPNPFPVETRPIIYVPTVKVQWDNSDADHRVLAAMIDRTLEMWAGHRGIIQSQSYRLTEAIMRHSRQHKRMIVYESGGVRDALDRVRRSADGVIIGPATKEGYDLGFLNFSIIAKVPQVNRKDPVQAARCDSNPRYALDQTSTEVQQMAGRIKRKKEGRKVVIIPDRHWGWIKEKATFPESFRAAFETKDRPVGPERRA